MNEKPKLLDMIILFSVMILLGVFLFSLSVLPFLAMMKISIFYFLGMVVCVGFVSFLLTKR